MKRWTTILSAAILAFAVVTMLLVGSERAAAQGANRPGAPASVETELRNRNQIYIIWTAPTDDGGSEITGYKVSVEPVGETPTKVTVGATVRNYLADGLEYGTRYGIRVAAINANGQGPWNGGHFVWTGSQQKQVPIYGELRVSFSSINVGSGIIAEGYNVTPPDLQVDITATSPLQGSRCPSSGADEPTWRSTPEPPADITRRFWGCSAGTSTVRLISDQTVLASTTVTVKGSTQLQPQPTATPKPTVSGLTTTATMTTVTLSWREQSGTQYEVSKLNDMGDYVVVASIFGSSYMDPGPLECRTEYTYRVRAGKNNQWGSYVTKWVSTTACACESINLVSPDDSRNVLSPIPSNPILADRPYEVTTLKNGDYPEYPCISPFNEDPNYGVLYRFRTEKPIHLHIQLTGADADPTVALVNNANNTILKSNDDSLELGTQQSQIAQVYGAGDYSIEVALKNLLGTNPRYWMFVVAQEVMPDLGHQRDHLVQYSIGDMPTTTTEAELFPRAIRAAAESWNTKATAQTPKVRFCEESKCPADTNDDEMTAAVSVAASTFCVDSFTGKDEIACAETRYSDGILNRTAIYLENPTYRFLRSPEGVMMNMSVKWGDRSGVDRTFEPTGTFDPFGNTEYYYSVYLRGVVIHEFGHIAGLNDLRPRSAWPGFAMSSTQSLESVPPKDIRYLDQIYRNRHGSVPHDGEGNPLNRGR